MAGAFPQGLRSPAAALPLSVQALAGLRRTALSGSSRGGACIHRAQASAAALIRGSEHLCAHQRRAFSVSASWKRAPSRSSANSSPSVSMARSTDSRSSALVTFRVPQTFVPPDLGKYMSKPTVFAKLYWIGLKNRFAELVAEFSVRLQSKKGFLSKPRFKANRKTIPPVAKNLHYQMLEATAAGDRGTLRRLLTQNHIDEVEALIARRPRGQKCQWELLSYKGRPQLVSHKVVMIPGSMSTFVRQAVVSIRSRQRFTWTMEDAGSHSRRGGSSRKAVAGSQKAPTVVEKDVKENVVLMATMDPNTWQTSDWRIFGFLPDTTLADWEQEAELMGRASKLGKA